MKKRKTFLGITALLMIGAVLVVNALDTGREWHFFGGPRFGKLEELNLPEDATREEIREVMWGKRLDDLGLTEESTIKELKEAIQEKREQMQEDRLATLKEKLELEEDATEEEVREALQEWREENKELFSGLGKRRGMRGHRFGKPCEGAHGE